MYFSCFRGESAASRLSAVSLLLVLSFISLTHAAIHVDPTTNYMIDEYGRVRIFHGVNAVYKVAPYAPVFDHFDPQESLSIEDVSNLYQWGFNFVRLGTMWPGLEAVRGQYNMTYLAQLEEIINALGQKDIVALLDCHQDVLARQYCGEGVPTWAAIPSPGSLPFPLPALGLETIPLDNSTGFPDIKACLKNPFFKYYFSQAASSSFQSLYDNVNGIQDSFAGFWTTVANFFKSNPHVIGYELLNEPWPGDIFQDFQLIERPGKSDVQNLAPMYEKLAGAIRSVDEDKIIFFEPTVTDEVFLGFTGLTQVPGGAIYNNRSVLSYHVYCGLTNPSGDPYFRPLCDALDYQLMSDYVAGYKRVGGGGFLTEFGASYDDPAAVQQINEMCNDADSFLQSWAWWQFKDFNDITTASEGPLESFYDANGQLQLPKVKALSRTYAYAIAGIPKLMSFDPASSNFTLQYSPNPSISKPTLVYLNQQWYYPKGFNVVITPSVVSWKQTEPNRIAIVHPASISPFTMVSVRISAK